MIYEIVEAVKEYYKDEEEVVVDCLNFLGYYIPSEKGGDYCHNEVEEMGYCPVCGNKLQTQTIRSVHFELDGNPIEYSSELFCPQCDIAN